MSERKTVYVARGEDCDVALMGLMLPHLVNIYEGYTIAFNPNAVFSQQNGYGTMIVVCMIEDQNEITVYDVAEYLMSEGEYGDAANATFH